MHGLSGPSLWGAVGAYVAVAAVAAVFVARALRAWLSHLATAKDSPAVVVLTASAPRPVAGALFLLSLAVGAQIAPLPWAIRADVRHFAPYVAGVFAVVVAMRISMRAIEVVGRSRPELRSTAGIGRAATVIVALALSAVLISDALGISLAPALTALGVGSLAVALALQDTLSNFFSGITLIADKRVHIGDFVRIDGGHEGTIETIGWRTTQLRAPVGALIIVPNATLAKAVVWNFSGDDPRLVVDTRFDFALDADAAAVEKVLGEEAARATDIPGVKKEPAPYVRFAPGVVDGVLAFTVTLRIVRGTDGGVVQHELRRRVVARIGAAKIAFGAGVRR